MQTKYFSPSINIQRDQNQEFHYISTRNGEKAFQKITSAFSGGTKSFNIIGAYGSGKSAFILALDKVLNNKEKFFSNPFKEDFNSFETTFIIGKYSSFKDVFCETFKLNSTNNIFKDLQKTITQKIKAKVGQLIVVDEFGKFLEYAAKESPEDELYFIQQLAEFANTPGLPFLFITTLHQPFEDYALSLSKSQKNEWDKEKARLVEISFNEPVEQLLFLASERIIQKSFLCHVKEAHQKDLFNIIQSADVFPMRDYFTFDFAKKLFPFDILSASIAMVAFQRYGQNERSLFSFLESEDYLGINDFTKGEEYFHIPHIYKYLKYNFHSLLNSRFNQDSAKWKALDEALQRAESVFDEEYKNASQILITIGLLSILGRQGQKISKDFLNLYSQLALGIYKAKTIIEILESKQLIRYRKFSQCYVLFKGTDFDLNTELDLAEDQVSKDFAVVHQLQQHFNFPIVPAKRIFFEWGTPRYFVYEITENPICIIPEGQVDGYINLIFNEFINKEEIKLFSGKCGEAILHGYFNNANDLKKQLIEIEKIQIVKNRCIDDAIAIAELDVYLNVSKEQLNKSFQASFFGEESNVSWYFNGTQKHFENAREMNLFLSEICREIYAGTPILRNELMNREKVSGTISSAKNKLIHRILEFENETGLSFDANRFPPEKTIYLTLLHETGIHQRKDENWFLGKPTEKSFTKLWVASEQFLDDCAAASRKLNEFINILKAKPFKLKQGFIDFWVPIFLIAKQKHFAFYELDTFIPQLTADSLEVAMKQTQKYRINTFDLNEKRLNIFNRYRYFLNLIEETAPDSDTFVETIKPFLVFYKNLVPFTKQTKQLSKEALRLRDAISLATDPEKVFFEDIPSALGFILNDFTDDQKIEDFSITLRAATQELSGTFPNLVNRIEEVISKTVRSKNIVFPENKLLVQKRFEKLKKERIHTKLRVLLQRINTPLEDRQSWINSIATAIFGKSLDQFSDDDELNFQTLFPKKIYELDNLTDISKNDIDKENEEVLKLEITSFVKGVQNNLVRLPKYKSEEIAKLEQKIIPLLNSKDRQANIALLIRLLQKEIENE